MVRFIYTCMAILIISFIAVPIFSGVSKEHTRLEQVATTNIEAEESLSFAQIYALASEATTDPERLNNIAPAAGNNNDVDSFSTGFTGTSDPALEDTPQQDGLL